MYGEPSLAERLLGIIGWIVGVVLALIVGSALITHTLALSYLPDSLSEITGWALIVLTLLGIILAITTRTHDTL